MVWKVGDFMGIKDRYELSAVNILLKMNQLKRAETLGVDELEALQRERFIKVLRHVIRKSEFYRNYYQEHGVDIEKIDQISLKDLPIIDKKIMMDNFDQFVCDKNLKRDELERFVSDPSMIDKKYKGLYEVIHTSGSSGRIGIFVYGPNDWSMLKAIAITRVSKDKFRLFKRTKLAFIGALDGHYAGISLTKDAPRLLFDFLPVDINRPIKESVELLNDFMPDSLSGYASGVYFLALEQLSGRLKIKPKRILCSADPMTESMSEIINKAFGVKPHDFYAASESIGMATQCDVHRGLHLFNDWHIFEVIKKNGEPAGPGESGNLVLTNLYNYTQPLIRYRMDDEIVLGEGVCSCGWSFPLASKVAGREEEFLYFEKPNGSKESLNPVLFIEFIVEGLEKLQVVQTEKNYLRLNVIIRGDKDAAVSRIKNRMDKILNMKNLADFVGYEINTVEDIPNDPKTGKFKLIIPLKD
ncbi:coenzyme F390 synthetase [Peptoclostridium acidaminophilum DSM 3953]|uniref:Coenzyme F390 synthetase n=1 Tax=Peptoclostridium acidaminophilum DSM 3953 TaxID=1286171 RepID=W8T651_PEPAC|nr:phenylacetate--CoA ligase family protein [Peptoclostridium acidaminophilum]AHM57209.1 coenzyme F390 synthetase [Peptoclostridium acidaminophilum DSM 3953]